MLQTIVIAMMAMLPSIPTLPKYVMVLMMIVMDWWMMTTRMFQVNQPGMLI